LGQVNSLPSQTNWKTEKLCHETDVEFDVMWHHRRVDSSTAAEIAGDRSTGKMSSAESADAEGFGRETTAN